MRILLVGPATPGGEAVYMSLLRRSAPEGVRYTSVGGYHEGGEGARAKVLAEVALNRLVRPRTIPDMGFRALALRREFDLVHVHAHPVRLTHRAGTPIVMSEGSSSAVYLADYLGWEEPRLARAFTRTRRIYRALGVHDRLLAMDGVARVYVFSDWARELNIRWGADPAKLDVVPPGFPTPPARSRRDSDEFMFLFIGSDFERKGGFDVVEAFERVSAAHPFARLAIAGAHPAERNPDRVLHEWVGEGRRRRVLETLERMQSDGRVRVHGRVSPQHVHEHLYPSADAFVMPTLAEGFGFTNVEAMSYGLPVVSSRVGPIPEIVEHAAAGLLVAPGDVEGVASAMGRLASDPEGAASMGAAARAAFLAKYTLGRFRTALGAVYESALSA